MRNFGPHLGSKDEVTYWPLGATIEASAGVALPRQGQLRPAEIVEANNSQRTFR